MTYTEPLFILFIVLFLFVVAVIPGSAIIIATTIFSLLFCVSFSIKSLIFILSYSAAIYILALFLSNRQGLLKQKVMFPLSCFIAIAPLLYFKYSNFFLQFLDGIFEGISQYGMKTTMPIGISFVTFQAVAYLADVAHGDTPRERSFWRSTLFLAYFPKLVAGPIVRAKDFFPQLPGLRRLDRADTMAGLELFLVGCFKKTVIADTLAPLVDKVFAKPGQFDALTLWCAALAYTIQIYADFSGYTDMARGVSRIMGIELPVNFKWPYFSQSIRDFWRRWHITLSCWLRDYIYIPLGGSHVPAAGLVRNILVTWLVCGLWHGASFTFILWGLYHGLFILLERALSISAEHRGPFRLMAVLRAMATFVVVMGGWILFRANSAGDALVYAQTLFRIDAYSVERFAQSGLFSTWHAALFLAIAAAHYAAFRSRYDADRVAMLPRLPYPARLTAVSLAIVLLVVVSANQENFIYALF